MHKQFFDHERELSDDELEANQDDEVQSTTYSDGATQHSEQSRPNAENDDDNEELEDSEEEDAEVRHAAMPPAKKQRGGRQDRARSHPRFQEQVLRACSVNQCGAL